LGREDAFPALSELGRFGARGEELSQPVAKSASATQAVSSAVFSLAPTCVVMAYILVDRTLVSGCRVNIEAVDMARISVTRR
jgi:hypothetical protein